MISVFALDYSDYDLTELQLNLLKRLEVRGYSEEKLYKFAGIFERENNKIERDVYIPPHTQQELIDTEKWAAGGAFLSFAKDAGLKFDREEYIADCPNWAIFGFQKAHAREYIDFNIMRSFDNTVFELDFHLRENPTNFKAKYLELIKKRGFYKYITM